MSVIRFFRQPFSPKMKYKTKMSNRKIEYLRSAVKKELTDNILSYWINNTVDIENGGFLGQINFDGSVEKEAQKGAVLNARILWSFSKAYNVLNKDEYLEMAHRAFNYLDQYFFDKENHGIYWALDYKGNPVNTQKYCYVQGFWIYGLSEYYTATKNEKALKTALEIFKVLEEKAFDKDKNGYIEAFAKDWTRTDDVRISQKDLNESKTHNTHLHLLEGYAALYRVTKNEQVEKSLENLTQIMLDKFYNPKTGHFKLFFNDDWQASGELVSYGHDIESAWLIWDAVESLGIESLDKKAKPIVLKISEVAANESIDTDGGQFYEGNSKGVFDFDKHWWPQAEAVVGFLNAWQVSGEEKFLDLTFNSWKFIENKIVDKKGEWYWKVNKKGEPYTSDVRAGFWKCPYHNSRACFEVMTRLK